MGHHPEAGTSESAFLPSDPDLRSHELYRHSAAHRRAPAGTSREGVGVSARPGHPEGETSLEAPLTRRETPAEHPLLQVARNFYTFVQESPYINYRIDLFAVGLEDNPTTKLSLADKCRALEEHRTKLDAFDPIQRRERATHLFVSRLKASGGGVYGFIPSNEPFIEFFTMGSVSRGVSRKE